MNKPLEIKESRWPHRVGCLLAAIVFPLIWVGNLVTTADAGMAVPDWPNTYGFNLFSYPYREWFYGPWDLFVEHGHRLLAALSGLIAILLVYVTCRHENRRWIKLFSIALLGLVIFQGVLGGVRVLMDARAVAKIHGYVGPAFFALTVAFCVVTSRWWRQARGDDSISASGFFLRTIPRFAVTMLATSYVQLCLGAFIRHIDDVALPKQFTLLVACHILTAVVLLIGTGIQFCLTRRNVLRGKGVKASINILSLLIVAQFTLGLGTWLVKFGWPIWFENYESAASFIVPEKSFFQINIVTAHAAIGSLILAFWTVHALRTNRSILPGKPEP